MFIDKLPSVYLSVQAESFQQVSILCGTGKQCDIVIICIFLLSEIVFQKCCDKLKPFSIFFSVPLQCLIFLDDPQAVSDILEKLVKDDNLLMAYQICFDLYESASQQFLSSVIQNLRTVGTPIPAVPGSTNTGTVPTPDKDRCGRD